MPKYVTAYAVTRHYGGPEEGGWRFNWYEAVETVVARPEPAETVRAELRTKHADQEWGDIYSMGGGVALEVLIEDTPAESRSQQRTHYE